MTPVLLGIVLLLFSAKLAGDLFDRVGLPPCWENCSSAF